MRGGTRPTRYRRLTRRAGFGTSALIILALACSVVWPAAAQASAYRYWTYWQGTGDGWAFATAGPAALVPADGSVEGWRFAVTTQAGRAGDSPRNPPQFDAICGDTPATADRKRVALVIDAGTSDAAPNGQAPPALVATCVVASPDATGYQVLRSVATVRTEGGLVCGIAGYPAGECAPVVDDPTSPTSATASVPAAQDVATGTTSIATQSPSAMATQDDASASSGTPWFTLIVAGLAALVAVLLWRRHRAN